jgi:hypothetical protein
MGLKLSETHTIDLNKTILVVGTIEWLEIAEPCIQKDGFIELDQLGVASIAGLDGYYTPTLITRHKTDRIEDTRPIGEKK